MTPRDFMLLRDSFVAYFMATRMAGAAARGHKFTGIGSTDEERQANDRTIAQDAYAEALKAWVTVAGLIGDKKVAFRMEPCQLPEGAKEDGGRKVAEG
jgi:hypothetical protein